MFDLRFLLDGWADDDDAPSSIFVFVSLVPISDAVVSFDSADEVLVLLVDSWPSVGVDVLGEVVISIRYRRLCGYYK